METQNESNNNVTPDNKDEKLWAMLCHLSALAGFVFPFGNIIAPLIIWVVKKDEFLLVADQGKESLNFQISLTIYIIAAVVLIFVAIGIVLLPILGLFGLIMIVIASIKANEGEKYRYPFTIRLIT
ncbi:DUF4870 domain-containing protein [Calditrichota bacterium]